MVIRVAEGSARMELEKPETIPLHATTWSLDQSEGEYVNSLKATRTDPMSEPLIEVPDDLKNNLAITSIDALVNWGRKNELTYRRSGQIQWRSPRKPVCAGLLLKRVTP